VRTIGVTRADGGAVCGRCGLADGTVSRMRGLLGRRNLSSGEGILLVPGGSIHTFFMRFAIDVVFLDRENRVVGVRPVVRPWRMAFARGARKTLELAAGEVQRLGLRAGEQLVLET
jgi:uncharacterized membrane protein (UPF0127 family)